MEDEEKMCIFVLDEETLQKLKDKKIFLAIYKNKIVKASPVENNEARIIGAIKSDQEVTLKGPPPLEFSDLYDDALNYILDYLDLDSLKKLSETSQRMKIMTDHRIESKAKVLIPFHTINGQAVEPLKRAYQNCEIIVENPWYSIKKNWYTFLHNSFSEVKCLKLRNGAIRWQELTLNLAEFKNLTSLIIHKVDLRKYAKNHPTPNLNNLEHLEVTFSIGIPSVFFETCARLKSLTFGFNRNDNNVDSLKMYQILRRQTILEKLIVFDRDPGNHSFFLRENYCSDFQFQLKSFFYFENRLRVHFQPFLSRFLESQRSLKIVALNFLDELFPDNMVTEQFMTVFRKHLLHFNGLEGANCSEVNDQQLKTLYFFDNTSFPSTFGTENGLLIRDLKRIFQNVKNLHVVRVPGCIDENARTASTISGWRTIQEINYIEQHSAQMLENFKLAGNCTHLRLFFKDEDCEMEKWKLFVENNRHIKYFLLKTLWKLTDDQIDELLRELANMTDLETLQISILDIKDHHVQLIATTLQNLKILIVEFDVLKNLTEDTKKLMGNVQLLGSDFSSISPDF